MALITASEYPAVRAALDTSLDSTVLPDGVIGLPIYQGAAEAEVLWRDPSAASRSGAEQIRIKNAVVFLTAARLAPRLPQITGERFGEHGYSRQAIDWTALAATLRADAAAELTAVLEPANLTPARPRAFTVAPGGRGT